MGRILPTTFTKTFSSNDIFWITIRISVKFAAKDIDNQPLSEQMITQFIVVVVYMHQPD